MSNYLAIAAATAALRFLLQGPIQQAVPGAQVRTLRPDLMLADRTSSGINLFLYRVNPNSNLRNADLPSRRSDGSLVTRPLAPLDLSYLISCFGSDDTLEPQRLLGATVATLRAWPLLPPSEIANAIAADPTILGASDLAQQTQAIHITMDHLGTEELFRIWSTLGTIPYNLSVAYTLSVVLVEEPLTPAAVLPVQQIHPTVNVTDDPAAFLASLSPSPR